jgi:hypothetical protein
MSPQSVKIENYVPPTFLLWIQYPCTYTQHFHVHAHYKDEKDKTKQHKPSDYIVPRQLFTREHLQPGW